MRRIFGEGAQQRQTADRLSHGEKLDIVLKEDGKQSLAIYEVSEKLGVRVRKKNLRVGGK